MGSIEKHVKIVLTAVEQAQTTVVITDINGMIIYANPKFYEVSKYLPSEVIGKSPGILKSGNTSTMEYEHLWLTLLKGEVWRGEFLNRAKTGELFWELATITPIRDDNNNITHFMKIAEVMDNLKHTVLNLWSVISLARHYVLIIDKDLTIKYANTLLACDLGYKNETEMIGRQWLDHIPLHFKEVIPYIHKNLVEDDKYREFTNDIMKLNGETLNVKWFNSFINGIYNWTLSIGIPLLREDLAERSIHHLREYWKEAIRQDKILIGLIKDVATLREKEHAKRNNIQK